MPALAKVLSVVFPVFCIIGLGYLFARFKTISLEPIIEVLLYLTIPALVISSLSQKEIRPGELFLISAAALGVVVCTGLASLAYLTITGRRDMRGFYLTTMFMNSANIPFPIALLAFGRDGLAVAVLYYIAISVLVYSIGIYIAKGSGGYAEIFRLPLIYAAVIGVGLNLMHIRLPGTVLTTMDMLGAATIPLMQISLGYRLSSTRLSHLGTSLAASVIRIGGGLLAGYAMVTLLGLEGVSRSVVLLTSAMPSAVINFVMSHRYKVQSELVASTVALSTVMSIATVPLILMWLM